MSDLRIVEINPVLAFFDVADVVACMYTCAQVSDELSEFVVAAVRFLALEKIAFLNCL